MLPSDAIIASWFLLVYEQNIMRNISEHAELFPPRSHLSSQPTHTHTHTRSHSRLCSARSTIDRYWTHEQTNLVCRFTIHNYYCCTQPPPNGGGKCYALEKCFFPSGIVFDNNLSPFQSLSPLFAIRCKRVKHIWLKEKYGNHIELTISLCRKRRVFHRFCMEKIGMCVMCLKKGGASFCPLDWYTHWRSTWFGGRKPMSVLT